VIVYSVNIYIQ